jgi:hypothetical protein
MSGALFADVFHAHQFLTMFNVMSSDPLWLWARRGTIVFSKRGLQLERALLVCPSFTESLGVTLPVLNVVFAWPSEASEEVAFEVHLQDNSSDSSCRVLRFSSACKRPMASPDFTCLPLRQVLVDSSAETAPAQGQLLFVRMDLAKMVARYCKHVEYRATHRIVVQGSLLLRFVFFSSTATAVDALPVEFR